MEEQSRNPNTHRITFLRWGIIIILLLSVLGAYQSGILLPRKDRLHIAVVGPFTGTDAAYGREMYRGIKLYVDEVNKNGGINGKDIKIHIYDDQNDPNMAQAIAKQIAQDNQTLIVLGHHTNETSSAAGTSYREFGIPVITGSAPGEALVKGNEWYFRVIFNSQSEGNFLASYVSEVLDKKTTTIIYDPQDSDSAALITAFTKTYQTLWGKVNSIWEIDSENLEESVDEVIRKLVDAHMQDKDSDVLFLAMKPTQAQKIIIALKRKRLDYLTIAGHTLGETAFSESFKEELEEKERPGYFTNGLYAASHIIFNIAGQEAQDFRAKYQKAYKTNPEWLSASYYDATKIAFAAIESAEEQATLRETRLQIRQHLADINSPEKSIRGTTGAIYFDSYGDAVKPVNLGVFANQEFISSLTQLQPVSMVNINVDTLKQDLKDKHILWMGQEFMYKTGVVYTGVKINQIEDFNVQDLTYNLDFYLWFRYQNQFEVANIVFSNADGDITLGEPIEHTTAGDTTYSLYHVNGRFKADFLPGQRVFRQHTLGISFHHRELDHHNLIYVADVLGMGLDQGEIPLTELRQIQVHSTLPDWHIQRIWSFREIIEQSALGDPTTFDVSGGNITYSQFNTAIQIRKNEFTLRRLMPEDSAGYLLMLSFTVALILTLASKNYISKYIWFFQAGFVLLALLTGEIVMLSNLEKKVTTYYLEAIVLGFDMLWWFIPALLIHMAIERFIWFPLEQKVSRAVPAVIRNLIAFIIYLLALFGVIAYVFNRPVTGVLASTGLVAMIVGLAIQLNLANIFSGITVNLEHPFHIGDWVKIDGYDEGEVLDISWRSTKVRARNQAILSIPNSVMDKAAIQNYNHNAGNHTRQIAVRVAPGQSPKRVRKLILDAVYATDKVLLTPPPQVYFEKSELQHGILYNVTFATDDYAGIQSLIENVWENIWTHLTRAGIPFFKDTEVLEGRIINPIDILREIDTFVPFSEADKQYLSQQMKKHHFSPNHYIVQQGDKGDSIFAILEGAVSVQLKMGNDETLEIARLGAGDFFGEISLLTGEPRMTSIITLTETYLYEITKADIAPSIKAQPEVSLRLSEILTQRKLETKSQEEAHQIEDNIDKATLYRQILNKIQKYFKLSP
ncbi:MAG: ABC transporter substrate-binding protein [Anaerolineae bacterium]|nr:ABC transporter substrate-binding protein [Anaerolineae bacterium]